MMIRIIKKVVLTSTLIVLAACSSMSGANKYDGIYYHEGDQSHYLNLKDNGKFELLEKGKHIVGYYKVRAGMLHLYKDSRCFAEGLFKEDYLLDPDKTKWIKSKVVNK
jgi:hypothetical protein